MLAPPTCREEGLETLADLRVLGGISIMVKFKIFILGKL